MDVTETHRDTLQNIEFAIVRAYEGEQTLLDLDVLDALDTLIRRYAAEIQQRLPPKARLSEKAKKVYFLTERMCEWRLGREVLGGEEDSAADVPPQPLGPEEIVACLKQVRKSVRFWNESAGRQGYLDYVREFVG